MYFFVGVILTSEQRKYCTTRKELFAVLRFCRQLLYYLKGHNFLSVQTITVLFGFLGLKT